MHKRLDTASPATIVLRKAVMSNPRQDELFVSRTYYLEGEIGKPPELIVSISRPYAIEPGFYRCDYRLGTNADIRSGYTEGLDEIDALRCTCHNWE